MTEAELVALAEDMFDLKLVVGGPPDTKSMKIKAAKTLEDAAKPSGNVPVFLKGQGEEGVGRTFNMRFKGPMQTAKIATESFTDKLDEAGLAFFNTLSDSSFSDQAVAFLNAYWHEVGAQAEFIFTVAYEMIKKADMHAKGVNYLHLYDEGNDLDFNIGMVEGETVFTGVLDRLVPI